jgi:murein DD-endopeptidase MepM/ murein hydrolase activator NlpD
MNPEKISLGAVALTISLLCVQKEVLASKVLAQQIILLNFNNQVKRTYKIVTLPPSSTSALPNENSQDEKKIYQVKKGDTIIAIARHHGVLPKELIESNHLENPDRLEVFQQLIIPASKTAKPSDISQTIKVAKAKQVAFSKVRRDRLGASYTSGKPLVTIAPTAPRQYNDMVSPPVGETVGPELPPLSVPDDYLPDAPMKFTGYIWPAKGVLTSGYGWRWGRMHKGVDIAAPIGTPIAAAAAGEVISAGWNSGGYGNLVKIKHPDGSVTLYAHNSRILVRSGQMVEQGDLIALMGSTGYSTGPHLHFEIHPPGQGAVNPIAYLPR